MTSLANAVGATTTTWLVDNDDIIAGLNYPIRLVCEDEAIEVTGAEYVTFTATERTSWTVRRGVDGTTPAAHAGLTAVTSGAVTTGAGGASPPFAQSDVTGLEDALAAKVPSSDDVTLVITAVDPSLSSAEISLDPTGEVVIRAIAVGGAADVASLKLEADGTTTLTGAQNADPSGSVVLGADGSVGLFTGVLSLVIGATGFVFTGLPTADPVVAGALYSNAGVVMVSAG